MAISTTPTDTLDSTAGTGVPSEATTTTTGESPVIINAFHPDYMKTYYPDFMKDFRTVTANQEERKVKEPRKIIRKPRASVKIPKQEHIRSKSNQSMTMAEVKAEILKRTNFYTYSKAGAPK
jgi:hypothetical protein